MEIPYYILHDIPGRIRLRIPTLSNRKKHEEIERFFAEMKGIISVKIEPIIQTMVVTYQKVDITKQRLLRNLSLFFHHEKLDPLDPIMLNIKPQIRKELLRSFITGALILIAYAKRFYTSRVDAFDYIVVITTAHTVLSHGNEQRFRHPDILTGIISLFSLGTSNLLHVCMVTWAVNVLEILHDIKRTTHRSAI
ncbi:HMA2 domain-containing protein [Metabacillus iocasae]|uniref:Uncharacterized protein n=1 Tax=Priestia iocasae TaxID=2291674 RepID=A0ABS2R2W2_9BACI|nr:hypothetical protein [Metabacillus iocasae]MBM7705064.1 hypothetical protein [Metabacillus iocasae]